VTARINISSPDTQAALNLADLSMSGFSIRSEGALPVGQVMRFYQLGLADLLLRGAGQLHQAPVAAMPSIQAWTCRIAPTSGCAW
jgi:hypothetical protein